MKKVLLAGLLSVSTLMYGQKYLDMIDKGTFTLNQIEKSADKYFDEVGRGKGTGYKQYQRWLYNATRNRKVDGVLVSENAQLKSLRSYKKSHKSIAKPGFSSTATWQDLGPTYKNGTSGWNPGVGRITSIGIDESDLNHYIVGGPNCGVWKTTDDGANWTNITDGFQDLNVWSLEISQHDADVYYWGSNAGDMFKSTDGGSTWVELTFPGSGTIRRIAIHPTDPNIIFAASNDLYKSTNGGASWTSVHADAGYDIEFKPGDPSVVYYSANKVYKSTNTGGSFSELTGGFSTSETKMMAVTPDNPNLLLVLEERSGKFGGLYKSTNSGSTFSKIQSSTGASNNYFGYDASGNDDRGQAPRDMDIIVDPSDENIIILAGIQCWKSVNGGSSFSINTYWTPGGASSRGIGYNHADVDILVWHSGKVFAGTDGGVYTSTDKGGQYIDKTTGISCREFYRIGVSKTDPNVVTGGSQDNGTSCMRGASREWVCWLGADGMESFVDWSNPNKLYGTSQNGSMYKSTNQGNSRSGISGPSGDGAWVTPFEQDPIDASVIYVGYNEVFKSSNDGGSWTQISSFGGGSLDELKIAPTDNNYIYCADGGTLRVTKNGGTSWSDISPGGTINYIHVSPRDKNRVVAVTSWEIYISTDAGSNWSNYTKNLPSVNYECAIWADNAENGLYVGGLGFVSYIEDGMDNYVDFWDGLPMVSVRELEINYVSNTIFAGTYGRGLWESDLYTDVTYQYDVAVSDLENVPSAICGASVSPTVKITNNGSETLTSVKIAVLLGGTLQELITHNCDLAQGEEEVVVLSEVIYSAEGSNEIVVVVSEPNGETDQKDTNDEVSATTSVEFGTEHVFYIDERSASNTLAWYIREDGGTIIRTGNYTSATVVGDQLNESVCIPEGCYNFVISEAFSSGGCSTPAWNASTVYVGDAGSGGTGTGEVVSHEGKEYRAQWWTQNNEPGTPDGNMWLEIGDCNVTYDTDVYGLNEVGESAYFEVQVQDYTSPKQDDFCFGSSLVVDFSSDEQVVNHCDDIVFTANVTGGTPTSYSWSFGADASPATAIGEGPHTVKYLNAGMKTVALTVDGVTESKSNYMMVSLDPSKQVSADIVLTNSPTCIGDEMIFSSTVENGGSSPVYSWMVDGTAVGTSDSFSSSTLENGERVSLGVTSDDECSVPDWDLSNEITVDLTEVVSPSITIDLGDGEIWPICIGDNINLKATTEEGGVSETVTWKINGVDEGTGSTFEFSGDNGDKLTAVLNSSLECIDDNDVVSNEVVAVVDICTSTEETEVVELSTFPNPVVDVLTVNGSGISQLTITEVSGKIVAQINAISVTSTIDMSQFAPGNYLVKVEFTSGSQEVLEIQKK